MPNPNFQYPATINRTAKFIAVLVLALNLAEYVLEWIRVIYAVLYPRIHLPYIAFLEPFQRILVTLLIAHLGLFIALLTARAIAFLAPQIFLRANGIVFQSALGQRFIPFTALRAVRSVELHSNGRFVVWVHSTRGLPLQGLLASLLFGRWLWRGFLLTSDLAGFDDMVAAIVSQLKLRYGEEKLATYFAEVEPTWLLQMINTPTATIRSTVAAEMLPITPRQAAWHAASAIAALALPFVVSGVIHLQIPFAMIVVLPLALVEIPLAALYLTAIPITEEQRIEFNDALQIYPLTQLPRWVICAALTLLVIAGVPYALLIFAAIPAAIAGCYTVMRLTEAWFRVSFPNGLLGVVTTLIVQLIMYTAVLLLLPR